MKSWEFFNPSKQHMDQNRPFDVFNGHDMFSQGQQCHSWSISDVVELSKLFFRTLRAQKREKSTSKSPKYALFWCFKAYSSHFQCNSPLESMTWDNFLSAVCPSIFHSSSSFWPRVVWNLEISNNSRSKSRGAMKNRRAHCGKEIISSHWF